MQLLPGIEKGGLSMERYFCRDKKDYCDKELACRGCEFAKGSGVINGVYVEDVLSTLFGDNYNLDRLKELVKADREGRCTIFPCRDWLDLVFGEQEVFYGIDTDYIENPIREITVHNEERFIWYDGWKNLVFCGVDENGLDWEFSPEEVGKTVFLTEEQAESALKTMKEREEP